MGLREEKAARTREQILSGALRLFLDQGYDFATMEEVATQADVSESTLYRYFPTKDSLVLDPIAIRGHMARALRSRPASEALDLSLGHALQAVFLAPRAGASRLRTINAILAGSLSLQGRLTQQLNVERSELEQAVAERLDRPATDPYSIIAARMTTLVLELVAEQTAGLADDLVNQPVRVLELARTITDELRLDPPPLPRLEQ